MEPSFKNLLCLWTTVACLTGAMVGCTDPGPLEDDQPRTPYTHYNELRGDDPPLNVENALGESQPNLRGRLLEKK